MLGVAEPVLSQRMQYPVEVPLSEGLKAVIWSTCDQVIYDDIFRDREYEPAVDAMVDRYLKSNRSSHAHPLQIVDLGMNLGYFSLYVAHRLMQRTGPEVHFHIIGVEAVPELAQEARRRLNGMWISDDIQIHTGLVGKRSGSAGIEMSLSHPANRIARGHRELAPDTTTVRLLRYRDLLSIPNVPEHIDLLKCDIEGAEEEFCESYPEVLERCDAVVMELHHDLCSRAQCRASVFHAGLTENRILNEKQDKSLMLFTRSTC